MMLRTVSLHIVGGHPNIGNLVNMSSAVIHNVFHVTG